MSASLPAAGLGLIGAGFMGRAVARDVCAAESRIRVNAVYDPNDDAITESRKVFGDEFRACPSIDTLLSDDSVDWVMIASWNRFHAEHTIAALAAGKNVFCQKPLAITLEECLAMRDAWRNSRRAFVIGFNLRYSAHYRKIRELTASGAIGTIVSLEFNETLDFNHGGFIMSDWRRFEENAGSHLLEKCCHDIDLANWVTGGRASRVASFAGLDFFTPDHEAALGRVGRTRSGRQGYMTWRGSDRENPFTSQKDIVDNQVVIIEYNTGARATLHINSNTAIPERRMYICGTEGTLRADLYTGTIEVKRIGFGEEVVIVNTADTDMHGGGDQVLARELADAMLNNTGASTTMDDGIDAAVTCFAIDDAARQGRVVDCHPYWAQVDGDPINPVAG